MHQPTNQADCEDENSLVSDSAALTTLLHVRSLEDTLVTIHIRIPDDEVQSHAHRRAIMEDLVTTTTTTTTTTAHIEQQRSNINPNKRAREQRANAQHLSFAQA